MTVLVFLSQKRNFSWKLQTVLPHFVVQQDWEEKQTLLFLCGRNCRDFYVVTQKLNLMRFYPFGRFLTHTKLHFPALIFLFFFIFPGQWHRALPHPHWEVQKFQAQDVPRCVNRYFNQWIKMINLNLVQNASWAALHISSTWVLTRIRGSRCASGSSLGSLWTLNNPSLGLGVSWQFPHQGTFRCENSSRNNLQGFAAKSLGWKAEGEGESSRLGSSRRFHSGEGAWLGHQSISALKSDFPGAVSTAGSQGSRFKALGILNPNSNRGKGNYPQIVLSQGLCARGMEMGFVPSQTQQSLRFYPLNRGLGNCVK